MDAKKVSRREEARKAKRAARKKEKRERQKEGLAKWREKSNLLIEAEHERHMAKEARRTGQSIDAVREYYKKHPVSIPAPEGDEF